MSLEITDDERGALELLEGMLDGEELTNPVQSVRMRSEGMSPSRIADELGCSTADVNEWLDRFERGGPLELMPEQLRPLIAGALDRAGYDSLVPDELRDAGPSEPPPEGREGIDSGWRPPSRGPVAGASARTPEGLMFLNAIDEHEGLLDRTASEETLQEWLVANGCTSERAQTWLERARAYQEAVAESGPPRPADFGDR